MKRTLPVLLVLLLSIVAALPLAAADAPAPKIYVLHQEVVRPSMTAVYEETTKELIKLIQEHRSAAPTFHFNAVAGDDFTYLYVTQLPDFTALDTIPKEFEATAKAVGEAKWGDLMKRNGQAVEYIRETILLEDPSLSYTPASPRLKPEEMAYFHYDLYYVQPGRETEADALAREFVELFRKKGIPDGYRLFRVLMGAEMPMIAVMFGARDAADYQAQDAKGRQILGPEGAALFQRAFSLSRRFESHNGWWRADLSLPPAPAQAAAK